jgi:serine/threonine protein kinase
LASADATGDGHGGICDSKRDAQRRHLIDSCSTLIPGSQTAWDGGVRGVCHRTKVVLCDLKPVNLVISGDCVLKAIDLVNMFEPC